MSLINTILSDSTNQIKVAQAPSFELQDTVQLLQWSSSYHKESITLLPLALQQKLTIAANITTKCKEVKDRPENVSQSIVKQLQDYTKLPNDVIKNIYHSLDSDDDRSFANALKDATPIGHPTLQHLIDDIRSILVEYYTEKRTLPSEMDLIKELKSISKAYRIKNVSIQKLVKNKLIKYHRIPELNRYVLMENPERVYKRTLYLKSMKQYRSQGKSMVYVEIRKINPQVASTSRAQIVGLVALPYNGTLERLVLQDNGVLPARIWLKSFILPQIPTDSVIVLLQSENKLNELTAYSKRTELMQWLHQNNVPFEESLHTAELYSLYKSFKRRVKAKGKYDGIFLNAGFQIVNCPVEWRKLNIFDKVWSNLHSHYTDRTAQLHKNILDSIKDINYLDQAENRLIEEEKKLLREDTEMETVTNNIVEMVQNNVKMVKIPADCSSDKTDKVVSDIIVC